MAGPHFDIVFRGVREGYDAAQVKLQFAHLFRVDAATTDRVFKAKRVTLKANLNEFLADRYIARLTAMGIRVDKLLSAIPRPLEQNIPPRSLAIHLPDKGEEHADAGAMHQPVELVYGEHLRRIPFVFKGGGFEYAKIWLVNLLVCVLSAGLLLPWAQARSRRYFYQHTHLDGIEFGYTSRLNKMLWVQVALTAYLANLGYSFVHSPNYFVLGLVMLLTLLPLFILKLNQFHLAHSSYRDIHLVYHSSIQRAYFAFLVLPLLLIITVGLAAPWVCFKMHQYKITTKAFDRCRFVFTANWKSYLSLLPSVIIADLISAGLFYGAEKIPALLAIFLLISVWLMVFIRWRVLLANRFWNATSHPMGQFVATWHLASYNKLLLQNIFFCCITLGFYWPWAKVRMATYKAQHLAFFANLRFKKWKYKLASFDNENPAI